MYLVRYYIHNIIERRLRVTFSDHDGSKCTHIVAPVVSREDNLRLPQHLILHQPITHFIIEQVKGIVLLTYVRVL